MEMDTNPVRKIYEHNEGSGRRVEIWAWDNGGLNLLNINREHPNEPEERIAVVLPPSEMFPLVQALLRHPGYPAELDARTAPTGMGYMLTLTVGDAKLEISDSASLTAPAMALLAQGVSESMARFDALGEPPYSEDDEAEDVLHVFLGRLAETLGETPITIYGDEDQQGYLLERVADLLKARNVANAAVEGARESANKADLRAKNAERQLRSLENVLAGSPLQSVVAGASAPWAAQHRAEALIDAAKVFVQIRGEFSSRGRDFPPAHTPEAVGAALADQAAITELRNRLAEAKLTRLAAMTVTDLVTAIRELIVSRQNAQNDATRLEDARKQAIKRNAELIEERDSAERAHNFKALELTGRVAELENALRAVRAEFVDSDTGELPSSSILAFKREAAALIIARIERALSPEEPS